MGGCNAFCRFGYYWPVQKLIFEDLGYDNFTFIPIDYEHPLKIVRTLKNDLSNGRSYLQVLQAIRKTWLKNRLTDSVDDHIFRYRALETERGRTDKVAEDLFWQIVNLDRAKEMKGFMKKIPRIFEKEVEIEQDANPIKIGIIGEIYVVLEPSLNVDVHRRLNELGVIVKHQATLRRFIDIPIKLNPFRDLPQDPSVRRAKPYLEYRVGGEAQESIGESIIMKEEGWDGMVHLYPFTCMPEIISRSILPQISREFDMPVLSLVVDEQTGEAGFQTRLEAFVDLLERKRNEGMKIS